MRGDSAATDYLTVMSLLLKYQILINSMSLLSLQKSLLIFKDHVSSELPGVTKCPPTASLLILKYTYFILYEISYNRHSPPGLKPVQCVCILLTGGEDSSDDSASLRTSNSLQLD